MIKYLFTLSLIVVVSQTVAFGQTSTTLKIGDQPPAIKYSKWLKGNPIKSLDKSQVYVFEFWATWCSPCKAAMPHLTKLQEQYKGKATFIGVDVWEKVSEGKPYESSLPAVASFVKGNDANMGYAVMADNNEQFMGNNWLKAAGEQGIPTTFIVQNNRIIWIGHPNSLDSILPKIFEGKYDMEEFSARHNKRAEAARKQSAEIAALLKPIDSAVKAKDYKTAFALIEEVKVKMPMMKGSMDMMKFKTLLVSDETQAIEFLKTWQKEVKSAPSLALGEVYNKDGFSKSTYLWVAKNYEEANFPGNPLVFDALAATYAKGGNYALAVKSQEKAVEEAKKALKESTMAGTVTDETVTSYERKLTEYKRLVQ